MDSEKRAPPSPLHFFTFFIFHVSMNPIFIYKTWREGVQKPTAYRWLIPGSYRWLVPTVGFRTPPLHVLYINIGFIDIWKIKKVKKWRGGGGALFSESTDLVPFLWDCLHFPESGPQRIQFLYPADAKKVDSLPTLTQPKHEKMGQKRGPGALSQDFAINPIFECRTDTINLCAIVVCERCRFFLEDFDDPSLMNVCMLCYCSTCC